MKSSFISSKLVSTDDQASVLLVEYNLNQQLIEANSKRYFANRSSFIQSMISSVYRIRSRPIKNLIILCFCLSTVFIYYYFYHLKNYSSLLPNNGNSKASSNEEIFSIIIDAGSTGSRIHVFRLKKNGDSSMPYKLVSEDLFKSVKPGLSSYPTDTQKAADSLKPLLDEALAIIPKREHKTTRLTLKATAGLRLISDKIAYDILKKCDDLFDSYPFYHTDKLIEILDGKFEGIYSWVTLMYAIDGFDDINSAEACALDLGGGSTQITFLPKDPVTSATAASDTLVDFTLDKLKFKVYTKSFLGYGLMSARMGIFKADLYSKSSPPQLASVCLGGKHTSTWKHQNVDYTVQGISTKEQNFDDCYSTVKTTVENKLNAPVELRQKKIFAFSFYYDRLSSAKLLEGDGGAIKIENILNRAKASKSI